jgi:hypothetical protein
MGSGIEIRTDLSIYKLAELKERFDVILCMGVYYHLVDPFLGFSQVRHCSHGESIVVFEGDFVPDWFLKRQQAAYLDLEDGWHCFMPTLTCMRQMLEGNYFHVLTESIYQGQPTQPANRVFLVCKPFVAENAVHRYPPPLGLEVYDRRFSKLNAPDSSFTQNVRVDSRAESGTAKPRTDLKDPTTFISYAKNQEDVMLYRAFRDVKQGFYIDIGARDPLFASLTKAFYDLGWHGINIENDETYFQKLDSERPRDINLATGLRCDTGVSDRTQHADPAATHVGYTQQNSGSNCGINRRNWPCPNLDQLCGDCGAVTIHFLKIEVERTEPTLLQGFSFEFVRPMIIVLQATDSESVHQSLAEWEALVLGHRYRFIYFDGLSRFYASEEHADLASHFSFPPNCLDRYMSYDFWVARAELDELQARDRNTLTYSLNGMLAELLSVRSEAESREWNLQRSVAERDREIVNQREIISQREGMVALLHEVMRQREQAIAQRDRQLASLEDRLAAAHLRLNSIRSSISWKLTGPLREARRAAFRIANLFR